MPIELHFGVGRVGEAAAIVENPKDDQADHSEADGRSERVQGVVLFGDLMITLRFHIYISTLKKMRLQATSEHIVLFIRDIVFSYRE